MECGWGEFFGTLDTGVTAFEDRLLVAFSLSHFHGEAAGPDNFPGFLFWKASELHRF